jgi:hypothetical protein
VQEFSYAVPPSLARYRDIIAYEAGVTSPSRSPEPQLPDDWGVTPDVYERRRYSLGLGFGHEYTARHNAVVAACGTRWPRVRLQAFVHFPEVEEQGHATVPVELDLNRNVDGQCISLEALLQTMDGRAPEHVLRERCRLFSYPENRPLREVPLEDWERELSFFHGMSSTCDLVALGYLWHTGQIGTDPQTLRTLGAALEQGMSGAEPEHKDAAVYALAYAVDQLPPRTRPQAARQLLAPVQPLLVHMLAQARPLLLDDLARLLGSSGDLQPEVRQKVQAIAQGGTAAAIHARAILAASPSN